MVHDTSVSQPYVLFFNRDNTEGTNSSKLLCLMFMYVLFCVICVGTDFVVFEAFVV